MSGATSPIGLIKICPRCGRRGWVSVEGRDPMSFEIRWEARTTARHGEHRPDEPRRDTGISVEDLVRMTFGCGYDDRQRGAS